MRFLFAIWRRTGGGAERALSLFSSELAKQGHEVFLLQAEFSPQDYPVAQEVKIIPFEAPTSAIGMIGRKVRRIKSYRRVIRTVCPDVVIPFLGSVVTENFFASRFCGSAFISTIRNNPKSDPEGKLARWGRNCINFFSDAVFVQNEDQRAYYPAFMRKRVFVVPNPISPEYLECGERPEREFVNCVATGRLSEQKNHAMLIRAFLAVHKTYPQLRLTIFGEGGLRQSLERQIDEAEAREYIKLPGRIIDVPTQLQKADIYILSSDFEGMPNALMEAMATGLPCISTDCPTGPADLITDGENGLLIPTGDEQALIRAMLCIVEKPEQARIMGSKARQTIQMECSADKIAEQLAEQCRRFIKGGAKQ